MPDAEQMLSEIMASTPQEDFVPVALAYIFRKVVEIDATVNMMVPVLGAIAGKLGMQPREVRELVARGVRE